MRQNIGTVLGLIVIVLFSGCSEENQVPRLNAYNASVIEYFTEIALGFEFGTATPVTRRWEKNLKIFVGGNPSPELLTEMEGIVAEINALTTTAFTMEFVSDSAESNFYAYFGDAASYSSLFPDESGFVATNLAIFFVSWNGSDEITSGHLFVDTFRADQTEQLHLVREELTQSLGLAKDSFRYPESIFQQAFSTKTTEYALIDKDLIRLLYHPQMMRGIGKEHVEQLLTSILLAEQ